MPQRKGAKYTETVQQLLHRQVPSFFCPLPVKIPVSSGIDDSHLRPKGIPTDILSIPHIYLHLLIKLVRFTCNLIYIKLFFHTTQRIHLRFAALIFFVSRCNSNYVTIIITALIFTTAAESLFRLWTRIVLAAP